jgi:aminobenzoyl-glutamate utilization protein B
MSLARFRCRQRRCSGFARGDLTDVADVSWVVPTVQALGRLLRDRHAVPFLADGRAGQGAGRRIKGMIHAAQVMAATARALIEDAGLRAAARAAHDRHLAQTPYRCPIPPEIGSPVPDPS